MAIFLAVSTSPQGETVLTRIEMERDLTPGIYATTGGAYRAVIGPFPSRLAAHYIWWLWAKQGVKRFVTADIAGADCSARQDDNVLWEIEREYFLLKEGMTPDELADWYADLAAEYEREKFLLEESMTPDELYAAYLAPAAM